MKSIVLMSVIAVCLQLSAADTKRCFCKAVDAFNMGRILKDFSAVETHNHWFSVGCRRLSGCADTCDRVVQQWVCTRKAECEAASGGALVRSQYTASVCKSGNGHIVRRCGDCGFGGLQGTAPGLHGLQDMRRRLGQIPNMQ